MIEKVISGGQTGTDIAGLKAAKACGIETGGWIPFGYRTLAGLRPEYKKEFGLQQTTSSNYAFRTEINVIESDCTVRFASDWFSPGEKCTIKNIRKHNKPFWDCAPCVLEHRKLHDPKVLEEADKLIEWLTRHDPKIVNIAGNSETTYSGIEDMVFSFLVEIFRRYNGEEPGDLSD